MVYTIKFNVNKAPAYTQATASDVDKPKDIKEEKATTTSKSILRRCCSHFANATCYVFAGVQIGLGTFKRSLISLHMFFHLSKYENWIL